MAKDKYYGKTLRKNFARHEEVMAMPNLLEIQKKSYQWFLDTGLREVFADVASIGDYAGNLELSFIDYSMDEKPKYDVEECKARDATYAAPMKVSVRLHNKETGEIKEQEIFMGDFPLMTHSGTFVINGAERVVVSQIVRSPGIYYGKEIDLKTDLPLLTSTVIPYRGAWLEYETDSSEVFWVRIDKNRKLPITCLIRALGLKTDADILDRFGDDPRIVAGVKYFLVPNPANFSWMTVVTAMGQMFYSLSIAMGILVTFGSYMKKDVSIEDATQNVEVFDTIIAVMAGLMIIPAVFAFSDGDPDTLQAGPALMFITLPKVFASMDLGRAVGVLFFVLVLFAAVTSSIALTESAVSTFQDELGWSRRKATVLVGVIMVGLGTLSSLGYGPLAGVTVLGMQFLDFFDFLTNSVMMPIAAIATCLLVSRVVGVERIEHEVTLEGGSFRRT